VVASVRLLVFVVGVMVAIGVVGSGAPVVIGVVIIVVTASAVVAVGAVSVVIGVGFVANELFGGAVSRCDGGYGRQ
jgi:hypothetical protein